MFYDAEPGDTIEDYRPRSVNFLNKPLVWNLTVGKRAEIAKLSFYICEIYAFAGKFTGAFVSTVI